MIAYAGAMPALALLPVYALACARVTGLVAKDEILGTPRKALLRYFVARGGDESLRAYMLICQWCMSIWVAAPMAAAWWFAADSPWLLIPAALLAMSQLTGMMSKLGR